jgi:hypothetical protein
MLLRNLDNVITVYVYKKKHIFWSASLPRWMDVGCCLRRTAHAYTNVIDAQEQGSSIRILAQIPAPSYTVSRRYFYLEYRILGGDSYS